MKLETITSPVNPLIKAVVRLHKASERREEGLCIIEGDRTISTALERMKLETLFCTPQLSDYAQTIAKEARVIIVTQALMQKMSTLATPSGLLGIFKIPSEPSAQMLSPGLVLAQLQDPGNMGTLIRTAAACGITSVVIIDGVDPWSSKVIQASAGTIALVHIFNWSWSRLLQEKGTLKLYALVVKNGQDPDTIEPENALLVVGNEARGIDPEWIESCDGQITLAMKGSVESLNAAIAGSLALYLTFAYKHS